MSVARHACRFNRETRREIYCERSTCDGCSWHPEVEQMRREELRERARSGELCSFGLNTKKASR